MIFSFHIQKTAGTAFRIALYNSGLKPAAMYPNVYGQLCLIDEYYNTFDLFRRRYSSPIRLVFDTLRNHIQPDFVHGHFTYDSIKEYVKPEDSFLVWLREPVARVTSEWLHHVAKTMGVLADKKKEQLSFDNVVASLEGTEFDPKKWFVTNKNRIKQFLDGADLNKFIFIGEQEHYDQDIQTLSRVLDKPLQSQTINCCSIALDIPEDLRKEIEEINAEDVELYKKILDLKRKKWPWQPNS